MAHKQDIRTIVVIGAGTMGRGIAHVAAIAGFTTVLNDVSDQLLENARSQIRWDLEKSVEIGKLTRPALEETLLRLQLEPALERAVEHADLIIEAVPEQIGLKLDLFSRLDRHCQTHTIFASN